MINEDFSFRRNSLDAFVYNMVYNLNEYAIPAGFGEGAVVIDVGAHIGSFSALALARGAAFVCAVEVDEENFQIARQNLGRHIKMGSLQLIYGAVLGASGDEPVYFQGYQTCPDDVINTGGGRIGTTRHGRSVPTVSLDGLVAKILPQSSQRIRLLKLDCEGSEWPILLESNSLVRVDEICGELHVPVNLPAEYYGGIDRESLTVGTLEERLNGLGFEFEFEPRSPHCADDSIWGKFRARKQNES